MQFLFKTHYNDDIRFLAKTGEKIRVGLVLALMLIAPFVLQDYYLAELGLLLVYVIAGVGLMILTGHTGQVSFGHAGFLGIGAYCHSILMTHGVPFMLSMPAAVILSGLVGMAIGRSASKMHGFYLAIATLAFGILIETVFGEWSGVTGGHAGIAVPGLKIFGVTLSAAANLFRSPTGRSFVAVRDSELSARSLGVNVEWVKIQAFGVSAAITGLAGVLLAHHLTYLAPDVFGVLESLKLLLMIVVGGLGSIIGAIFGAIFVSILPVALSFLKDVLPPAIGRQAGIEPGLFGLIIVLVIVFEPLGIYGRWQKLRFYFETFPYYRKSSFVRQKSYLNGVHAVEDVSFDVEPGEVFAIIGPNGAGKSTIFNLISRLYEPTAGSIHYGDQDLLKLPAHRVVHTGIGRTFQNIELFEQATVLQNLLVGRHSHMSANPFSNFLFTRGVRSNELEHRRKVEDIIDLMEIEQYRDQRISDLSYGARKNVELARALCAEPSLLLLDEPASGLNNEETDDVSFWLEDIKHDLGVTLVMVEHDMNLVGNVADRVMAINDGKLIAIGTPDEIRDNYEVQQAYLGVAA
jgi:branched-chain amino acid transport system permease protein